MAVHSSEEQHRELLTTVEALSRRVARLEAAALDGERLRQHVEKLEAAAVRPSGSEEVAVGVAEEREDGRPSQHRGDVIGVSSVAALSTAATGPMTLGSVSNASDGSFIKMTELEPELYRLHESVWDISLFIGRFMGPMDTMMVVAFAMLNFGVQVFFCVFVWRFLAEPQINKGNLDEFLRWRLTSAHSAQFYDPATNTSLVRRLCTGDGASVISSHQQSMYEQFDQYLNFYAGPLLCTVSILIWLVTVFADIWNTYSFASAISSVQRTEEQGHFLRKGGMMQVVSINRRRYVFAMALIVLPRLVIDAILVYAGTHFLLQTNDLDELVLNAVALGFILSLDETFYLVLPRRARRLLEDLAPLEKKAYFIPGRKYVDFRSVLALLVCILTPTIIWFMGLDAKIQLMRESRKILCSGYQDFIYSKDASTGFIVSTATGDNRNLTFGHQYLAVLQLSKLSVERYTPDLPSSDLGRTVTLQEVLDTSIRTAAESRDLLECQDLDNSSGSAMALWSMRDGRYGIDQMAGSFCSSYRNKCDDSWIRAVCAETCFCDSMVWYDRQGCVASCKAIVQGKTDKAVATCGDVAYVDDDVWQLQHFLADFTNTLIAEDKLLREGTRTTFSQTLRHGFLERSSGEYSLIEGPDFVLAWNVSLWLSGTLRDQTQLSFDTFRSPCTAIPLINTIFDVDLCQDSNLLVGTIRGFCPKACQEAGCGSAPEPRPSIPRLFEMQRRMRLHGLYQLVVPRISCNHRLQVSVPGASDDPLVVSFETTSAGNGSYTIDACATDGSTDGSTDGFLSEFVRRRDYADALSHDFFFGRRRDYATAGCSATAALDPDVTSPEQYVISVSSATAEGGDTNLLLTCHTDGDFFCGSQVQGSTVGAPRGQRIFGFTAHRTSLLTFDTCGSQLDANVSVYRHNSEGDEMLPIASGDCGTPLTMPSPTVDPSAYRLVVKGRGSSEGVFSISMTCSTPVLRCGETVEGQTSESDVKLFKFNPGAAISRVVFDTCSSDFDTDLWISWRGIDLAMNATELPCGSSFTGPCYYDYNASMYSTCQYKANLSISLPPSSNYTVGLRGYSVGSSVEYGHFIMKLSCLASQ